jgi:hypothetical protein
VLLVELPQVRLQEFLQIGALELGQFLVLLVLQEGRQQELSRAPGRH